VRAFVLDGHSRAALEAVQALGRAGIVVDVAAEKAQRLAFRSKYPRRRLQQPSSLDAAVFLDWLRARDAEDGPYDLLVPATEVALVALNALPEGDALRAKAVLPSRDSLDTALDKQRTWDLARRLGIPVPECVLLEPGAAVPPTPAFPLVLKPVRSKVQLEDRLVTLEVAIVRHEGQRLEQLRAWLPHTAVQQQAYVSGRGVGVCLLYERGRKAWHFAHERIHELPLTGGASSYRRSMLPSTELLEASERLLDALAWHGVAMVEYKMRPDGSFCLMEINPRLWGSLALAIDAGVDFPLGLLALAAGTPLAVQPAYRAPYYTRNIEDDIDWLRANFKADHADSLLLTRPRGASVLELLRPALGCESWDHFDVHDLSVTWTILRATGARYARSAASALRAKLVSRPGAKDLP